MNKLLIALTIFFSTTLFAEQLSEVRTPNIIFAEGGNVAGFNTKEGLSQCLYQVMYIDLSNEAGKAQLSMVLSAKAAGQKIVRITYYIDTKGMCRVKGLQIQ